MKTKLARFYVKLLSLSLYGVIALYLVGLSSAQAQVIPIRVLIVKHEWATVRQQEAILRAGLKRMKETGVSHPIDRIIVKKDFYKKNDANKDYVKRLNVWNTLARQQGICGPKFRCHMLLPPVVDKDGISYGGGVAFGLGSDVYGSYFDTAYSIARIRNNAGLPRTASSITAVAHEQGHLNGAEHEDGRNIMHPAALGLGELPLPWALFSKELIDITMLELGLRKKSFYGFNDPNWNGRSFKQRGYIVEDLVK